MATKLLTNYLLPLTLLLRLAAALQPLCNGSPALCSRPYTNITHIGTHNSAFAGLHPSDNQNVDIVAQLNAGIRFLQAQVHWPRDEPSTDLHMCHASCTLRDAGTLTTYLHTIKLWLDAHPREVVTLLLVNGAGAPAAPFSAAFDRSGLQGYAFIPASNPLPLESWPTLGEMIETNTRLMAMLDHGADARVAPFILDEFSYYSETPFSIVDPKDFLQCKIDRPRGVDGRNRMMMMNHFLDFEVFGIRVPDRLAAPKTNAAMGKGSIGEQAEICRDVHGRWPNCVLVDWFDEGDVFEAQRRMNGL
ncbi:hypothetical protein B9Z65_3979 [Elsinoe australis]|uniref:PLC-like phosphodiesterase n=1 Tax=Elsinoe australis TaxID=40998 RepID=A0A2P7Z1H4_9PEZI|nr:hypothetical protein B9Z65_3979 [Elsinoe australis]